MLAFASSIKFDEKQKFVFYRLRFTKPETRLNINATATRRTATREAGVSRYQGKQIEDIPETLQNFTALLYRKGLRRAVDESLLMPRDGSL